MPDPVLVALARNVATRFELNEALVCAVIEQESGWHPLATRFEPAFFDRYVAPLVAKENLDSEEQIGRATSWGLLQVMGQVAREHLFKAPFRDLLIPETGITIGCLVLSERMKSAKGDAYTALLRWNGGANKEYPNQVTNRMDRYV